MATTTKLQIVVINLIENTIQSTNLDLFNQNAEFLKLRNPNCFSYI
jgi:hypothetical protein